MTTPSSRVHSGPRTKRSSSSRSRSEKSGSTSPTQIRPAGDEHETRDDRKARTRRALLDAALGSLEHDGFTSLSLREVSRKAGIVPTAFYRHFHDMDELGLALVDESIGTLHDLLSAARTGLADQAHVVRPSLAILVEHIHAHRSHFQFVARERSGGSPALRHAIRREIKLFATELAVDIARDPKRRTWPTTDIQMLANLLVTVIVATIESLLAVDPDRPDLEADAVATAAAQMTVVVLGAEAWRPKTS